MNIGWVKLHRQFKDWEWYNKSEMVHLFIHCLIKSNFKDASFQGIECKKGSFITSLKHLSDETNISIQTIRTCLKKLQSTKEIDVKSTNKLTQITICNYDSYQQEEVLTNKQLTNNQQTTNKQLTTIEEYKEYKEEKEDIVSSETKTPKESFAVRQQKFLDWFNNRVLFHKGKLGNFSILSKATQTNLKTILKNNYTGEQLNKAFSNMYNSKWVQETSNCTPTHFLVVDNFQRYLNQDSSSNNVVHTNIELN